jgi:hypothetical protein
MSKYTPKYIDNCEWDSINKVQSRIITIIDLYRHVFKREKIPEEKQYWSMCGAHFNKDGPIKGELGHITEVGLISPIQFNGVDRESDIIEKNRKLLPNIKWYHGDFLDVMEAAEKKGDFDPAIINYDGVMQPNFGTKYLKQIMKFIDYNVINELLLIANFILINPYTYAENTRFTIYDVMERMKKIYWFPKHWKIVPQAYTYPGASKNNKTVMGMIMFIKDIHDPYNIII